ncbi:hypothetical protein FRX31_015716 [Thalictrum thalictroides]|uniref:Uncharacterized protein n=1 Tax=Thalictrum thalictroides TaxID=46969 RepID=A0A7J6WCS8_THATH|nr:hypothetical protein FRX31_015716 [Thalictrum thalictroides]
MAKNKTGQNEEKLFKKFLVNCAHREPISTVQTNLSSTVGSEVVVLEELQQMGAIAETIYNSKTKEDNDNFVEFFVIPLAKELKMTTSMSKDGKKRMFSEITSQLQWKDRMSQMENADGKRGGRHHLSI